MKYTIKNNLSAKEIKANADIPQILAELCPEPKGNDFSKNQNNFRNGGLCPFHDDNNPNSFFVNLDTGAFYCFSCGAKGDLIKLVQEIKSLDFKQALSFLNNNRG